MYDQLVYSPGGDGSEAALGQVCGIPQQTAGPGHRRHVRPREVPQGEQNSGMFFI